MNIITLIEWLFGIGLILFLASLVFSFVTSLIMLAIAGVLSGGNWLVDKVRGK